MTALNEKQKQIVLEEYQQLFALTDGASDSDALALALCGRCPGLTLTEAQQACVRMKQGAERFHQLYQADESGRVDVDDVLNKLSDSMTQEQRQQFVTECQNLIWAQSQVQLPPEEELLSAGQAELPEQLVPPANRDPLILAAALYAAGVNADLPDYAQNAPEALGACAAASAELEQVLARKLGSASSSIDWQGVLAECILGIVILAALLLLLYFIAAGVAADAAVISSQGIMGWLTSSQMVPQLRYMMKFAPYAIPAAVAAFAGEIKTWLAQFKQTKQIADPAGRESERPEEDERSREPHTSAAFS